MGEDSGSGCVHISSSTESSSFRPQDLLMGVDASGPGHGARAYIKVDDSIVVVRRVQYRTVVGSSTGIIYLVFEGFL